MYQSHNAQCYQAGRNALTVSGATGREPRPLGSLAAITLLAAVLVMAAQEARAEEINDSTDTMSSAVMPAGGHVLVSLEDGALESVRGRYVDARALDSGTHDSDGFVILWDERPGGGGSRAGGDAGKSHSNGLGNQQSTSVTTWRGQ